MTQPYQLITGDPDPSAVHQLTFVPFLPDGRCAAVPDGPAIRLPTGEVAPGEHYLLDTALRVPLEELGFRRQRVRPFATAGTHVYAWLAGDRYTGRAAPTPPLSPPPAPPEPSPPNSAPTAAPSRPEPSSTP